MDFDNFKSDTKTVDAVVRNFEIIGEAAAHMPEEIVAGHPEIPWQDMRDMRNVLAHEYFGIDEKIVWETISNRSPHSPIVSRNRLRSSSQRKMSLLSLPRDKR